MKSCKNCYFEKKWNYCCGLCIYSPNPLPILKEELMDNWRESEK